MNATTQRKPIATTVLVWLLRGYKRLVSPMLPAACRFVPTCSEYAHEAVARHGAVRGAALAAWRLLRCHPLSRGGYDPVPVAGSAGVQAGDIAPSKIGPSGPWQKPVTCTEAEPASQTAKPTCSQGPELDIFHEGNRAVS